MRAIRITTVSILAIGLLAGSAVAVAAQEEEAADTASAAYVQGFLTGGDCCGDEVETYDDDGNRLTLRGMVASGRLEMDDQRISGDWDLSVSIDEFPQPETDQRVEIHWGDFTVTNADGSWTGTWTSTYDSAQFPTEADLMLYELTGTGAYDGLSALLAPTGSGDDWPRLPMAGAIYPGPLPPGSAYTE